MPHFIKNILSIIGTGLVFIGNLLNPIPANYGSINFAQLQPFTLAGSGISAGATTITVTSMTDIDGNTLTMSAFGSKGFATIEPDNKSREEQISFTGISTSTFTGVKHVTFTAPYTETSGVSKSHPGGAKLVISNTSGFYNTFANTNNTTTINAIWTFASTTVPILDTTATTSIFTSRAQFVTKGYADDLTVSGSPDASETIKGIVELATQAEMMAGTAAGGTGAKLVLENKYANATSSATTTIVVSKSNGKIDQGFLDLSEGFTFTGNVTTTGIMNIALLSIATTTINGPLTVTGPVNGNLVQNYTVGSTIDASTTTKAVYLGTDGRIGLVNAATASTTLFGFIGFALKGSSSTVGDTLAIQTTGLVSGFTGLSAGSYYYPTNNPGFISTTAGTIKFPVAKAVSTTQLKILDFRPKVMNGTLNYDTPVGLATTTIILGFRPVAIKVDANGGEYVSFKGTTYSNGGWTEQGGNTCTRTYTSNGTSATYNPCDTGDVYYIATTNSPATLSHGYVTNITDVGFSLTHVTSTGPSAVELYWQAIGY